MGWPPHATFQCLTLRHQDLDGNTALLCACAAGVPEGVQVLLYFGARAQHRNVLGYDALCCAAVGQPSPEAQPRSWR